MMYLEVKAGKKVGEIIDVRPSLNPRRQMILLEMIKNPYITKGELANKLGISETAMDNNVSFLRKNGFIDRVGKTKGGYWKVLE